MDENEWDYKTLSETEYMQRSWTPEQLETHFRDSSLGDIRREHAFFRFWSKWQNTQMQEEGYVAHEDLVKILEFPAWSGPVGQIIEELGIHDKLQPEDVEWLLQVLPVLLPDRTHLLDQIVACNLLLNSSLDEISLLRQMLDLRADWAVYKLLNRMPIEHLEESHDIIATSDRPKNARNRLLYEVATVAKRRGI